MQSHAAVLRPPQPALRRLAALTPLDEAGIAALTRAAGHPRRVNQHGEIISEGRSITEPLLLLDGWAARVRLLRDGRRQIASFVLPGDILGYCGFDRPVAASTIVALTPVDVCTLPGDEVSPTLTRAFAISRAMDEASLLSQITRVGRMNARERIADLMLEIHDRLSLCGLVADNRFALPLTQELVADALGLTSVHVNRMLQQARKSDELQWTGREVRLPDLATLRTIVGRRATRLT